MTSEFDASVSHRPDANRIALRAVRSILNAAQPFELSVEGRPVQVDVSRLTPQPWPVYRIEGLEAATEGPLPAAVRLTCTWEGGRTELLLSAEWWKTKGRYRHLIALRTAVASINREIGWVSVALPLRDRADGERVSIPAAFSTFSRRDEDPADAALRPDFSRLKAAVERSGLPRLSPWRMEACTIRLPGGEVGPSPEEAFRRLVHLALLKLPFFVRGEQEGISGKPLFEPGSLPPAEDESEDDVTEPPEEGRTGERRGGVGPMPGGVRQYKKTFDTLLGHLQEHPYTLDEFRGLLRQRYDVTGKSALHSYVSVLLALGVASQRENWLELTAEGEEYLRQSTPKALFDLLHRHFTGMLEVLVVAEMKGRADTAAMRTLLPRMLGTNWKREDQANRRRNWLLSLGATERDDDGDVLTPLGAALLAEHAAEVEPLRALLRELLDESTSENDEADEERRAEEEVTGSRPLPSGEPALPSGWEADQLDLTAELAVAHTKGLELPRLLLEQACAALSSGKHLLLVGPPGTGKTELAAALVETARAEGYCAGAFTATASADWTTFDTIGGYALQRNGSLEVRPGVFLRALERRQWLVIDELNRADVDRAFGELMTVLAGRGTDTALMRADERLISIGTEPGCTHRMPRTFRVIATMNTWDKTSLFRLSHAVQRRFALLHVDVPEDETYARLIELHASREGMDPSLPEGSQGPLKQLFSTRGMLAYRAIGPAVALDMVRYMRRRQASGDGLAEAMAMFLFPQLEGMEQEGASRMLELLTASLAGWTSAEAVGRLRLRYQELFPHLTFKSA